MTPRSEHTPEYAAALQILYAKADRASKTGRALLFRAIHHLTGQSLVVIAQTWVRTR